MEQPIEILPAVFWSHGTPMLGMAEDSYTEALHSFSRSITRPRAIVVVSPFGLSAPRTVEISANSSPRLLFDFTGFPSELYQKEYPAAGSPELSVRIASLLTEAGFETALNGGGGMDRGVWMPLSAAFPAADIPVIQISMPYPTEPQWILKMGKALAPLRAEGVLLVGSGSAVHNLQKLVWYMKDGPPETFALEFEDWLKRMLQAKNVEALVDFEEQGPHAGLANPKPEHFYPLFFTLGAAWPGDMAIPIFEGIQYRSISMFSFALMPLPKNLS